MISEARWNSDHENMDRSGDNTTWASWPPFLAMQYCMVYMVLAMTRKMLGPWKGFRMLGRLRNPGNCLAAGFVVMLTPMRMSAPMAFMVDTGTGLTRPPSTR